MQGSAHENEGSDGSTGRSQVALALNNMRRADAPRRAVLTASRAVGLGRRAAHWLAQPKLGQRAKVVRLRARRFGGTAFAN